MTNWKLLVRVFFIMTLLSGGMNLWGTQVVRASSEAPVLNVHEEPSAMVNLNTATAEDLIKLQGVGPAIAERILEYRNERGAFESPEELANIRGIGEAKLQKIRNHVTI